MISRRIPVEGSVESYDEVKSVAAFLTGALRAPQQNAGLELAIPDAIKTSAFFMHGLNSLTGVTPPADDSKDTFIWTLPGSCYKTKVELPRVGDGDEVTV